MTAVLLRLLGLASQSFCTLLARSALLAIGTLCDFGSPHRAACVEAMAVVASERLVQREVTIVLGNFKTVLHALGDIKKVAADVALALVEAAAQRGAPPPSETKMPLHITGVSSWLPMDSWTLFTASLATSVISAGIIAEDPDIASASSIRRKVIGAAMIR